MKADWDDAPRHVRRNGKNAWVRWLVPGLAGCALVFGLLNLAGTHFAFPRFNDQPAEPPAEYVHTDPYGNGAERQPQTATAEEQFWADQRRKEEQRRAQAQAQQRQTDFNDHNYTPRQPDNVVSMEGVRQSLAYQQPKHQATTRRRSIEKDARWIREVERWRQLLRNLDHREQLHRQRQRVRQPQARLDRLPGVPQRREAVLQSRVQGLGRALAAGP